MGTVTASTTPIEDLIWQDRDLRFDIPASQLALRRGEVLIDSLQPVEDTKGNNSDKGQLSVSNLRLLYVSEREQRSNLSIGLCTIVSIAVKATDTRLRGKQSGLFVTAKSATSRFEFVFTYAGEGASFSIFTSVQAVYRSYDTTRLYRDLKLRGAIIRDKTLILLPDEQVYSKVEGVWNLSSEQGNLGSLFVTNVRLVWHANLAENFNVSIPYQQIKVLKLRDSKFGHALVIETSARSGGYILGFRMDPMEVLTNTFQEVKTLHAVYAVSPLFGVAYDKTKVLAEGSSKTAAKLSINDDVEIVGDEHVDVLASYLAEGAGRRQGEAEVVYCKELGLAMEKLRGNVTVKDLWNVL